MNIEKTSPSHRSITLIINFLENDTVKSAIRIKPQNFLFLNRIPIKRIYNIYDINKAITALMTQEA
jgi:hypothetical protein